MSMVHVVIGLAVLQFFVFGGFVGRARVRAGVEAPKVSGDPVFERYFRVHYNTMEQLVTFVPSILLFAVYVNATAAWMIGVVYLFGRALYFRAYTTDPTKRGPGFGLSMLPIVILLLGGLGGAIRAAIVG